MPLLKILCESNTSITYPWHAFITHRIFVLLGEKTITKHALRHLYQTRSKTRVMDEIEEVQEQMKADMMALKDQMASMMEAMLSMKTIMESSATAAAAAGADPTHPSATNQAHRPIPDMVGQGGEVLGSTDGRHMGYNRNAYPYGLPPQLHAAHHE